MKDPIDIGTDTVNKAVRDGAAIALLKIQDNVKKIKARELKDGHLQYVIGIYDARATAEDIGEDIRDAFNIH